MSRLLWGWIGLALALAPLNGVDVYAQTLRVAELQGVLSGPDAYHFYGLEAIQPDGAVALTLEFASDGRGRPSRQSEDEAVNFAVLTEAGLVRFLAGADLLEAAVTAGSPPLFDPADDRRTAVATGAGDTGYTVVVYSKVQGPSSYTLRAQGGLLRDDAGQSLSVGRSDAFGPEPLRIDPALGALPVRLDKSAVAGPAEAAPVEARRVTGALPPGLGRHYLRLIPDAVTGEVALTLHYLGREPIGRAEVHEVDGAGAVNFWLLTQEGVRHLAEGGLIQELNLASGAPVVSLAGATVLRAKLAAAATVPYVVVVENRSAQPVSYTLTVEGARLVDEQGQTNEAKAAALEQQALARR